MVVCSMLVLAACDSDSDTVQAVPPATLKVQVLHGSPDAPAVNVLVGGSEISATSTTRSVHSS